MPLPTPGDDVSRPIAAVERQQAAWSLIDALMGGTFAMRKAGRALLPQWPSEDPDHYEVRRETATLFPAYARTVSVLTGKPFSKPITLGDDVPPRIVEWMRDADADGRNLDAFAAAVFMDALAYGFAGIMVDAPADAGAKTVADEAALGVRPYLVHVKHGDVLGWRTEKRGAASVLSQIRVREWVDEPDGLYGVKRVEQIRVLEPGRWEVFRKAADGIKWVSQAEGTTSLDAVPFVPVYGFRESHMIGKPPMLELAHLNVEHWQSASDQRDILHAARVPIVFARGVGSDESIPIGAGAVIKVDRADADMKFVEHSGSAIGAGRESILDLEDKMRQVGAELLVVKPGNLTVMQTRADDEPAKCDLQRIAAFMEDALDTALGFVAAFAGMPEGGHVSLYDDYGAAGMDEASLQLLETTWKDGGLTLPTLLREYKRRGVLSPEVDVDEEVDGANAERDAAANAASAREHAMLQAASMNIYHGENGDDEADAGA